MSFCLLSYPFFNSALINYAETDAKAAPDIKMKLRFVAKSVLDNPIQTMAVVVMLAVHGGVCNVMKEVGIRTAYSALADTLKSDCDANDPKNKVLRLLYDLREFCVEGLYHAQALKGAKSSANSPAINTHNLIVYRNGIHKEIGLKYVPDPNMTDTNVAVPYIETFFERFYHLQCIMECVHRAVNEPPRKLNYNTVVSYLQYHRPEKFGTDAEEFLFHCFDTSGLFTRGAVAWMLYQMGIFSVPEGGKVDEEALFPKLDEDTINEIRASRELLAVSAQELDNKLSKSAIGLDEIRHSSGAVSLHVCQQHEHEHEADNNNNNNNNSR